MTSHRAHDHADDRPKPSVTEQLAGLAMFQAPAGSQPKATSEDAADAVVRTGRKQKYMALCLQRLGIGPVTADAYLWELQQLPGNASLTANSVASRFSELQNQGLAEQDQSERFPTRAGGTAFRYRLTVKGKQVLREAEAGRLTRGGSFGPLQEK